MWQINESFKDYSPHIDTGYVNLNADKPMNPYAISYPITWSGFVSGNRVTIIQKGHLAKSIDDFEFIDFPHKYSYIKGDLVKWIDDYLRILD